MGAGTGCIPSDIIAKSNQPGGFLHNGLKTEENINNKKSTPGVKMLSLFTSYFWFFDYSEIS